MDWWRGWIGEDWPEPPAILTEAEATERVRAYAEANGYTFHEPIEVRRERRPVDAGDAKSGQRFVYVMALGTNIPMPFVEVDATDGTVIAWRSLSR